MQCCLTNFSNCSIPILTLLQSILFIFNLYGHNLYGHKLNIKYHISLVLYTPMEVNIDFDAASKAWQQNKISIGNGCYVYRCIAMTKKGEPCKCKPLKHSKYCRIHLCKNPITP